MKMKTFSLINKRSFLILLFALMCFHNNVVNGIYMNNKRFLVWEDNFDGNILNDKDWSIRTSNQNGNVLKNLQYYTTKNVNVKNGMLSITALNQEIAGTDATYGTNYASYTSGNVDTHWKKDLKYGHLEIRAKMPHGQGLWPVITLNPSYNVYGDWAMSGEMIIVNQRGSHPSELESSLYYGDFGPKTPYCNTLLTSTSDLSADFHTYELEWNLEVIRFYLDGINYKNCTGWFTHLPNVPRLAPFDQLFYLNIELKVGGYYPGNPNNMTQYGDASTMFIDYIKLYQNATHNATVTSDATTASTSFGKTQIIAIVVVIVVVLVALLLLCYFYKDLQRKRALSEAPPLETISTPIKSAVSCKSILIP